MYKRQVDEYKVMLNIQHNQFKLVDGIHDVTTVSYTHLDVYKRQLILHVGLLKTYKHEKCVKYIYKIVRGKS